MCPSPSLHCTMRLQHCYNPVRWSTEKGKCALPRHNRLISQTNEIHYSVYTCGRGARPTSYTLGIHFAKENATRHSDFARESRCDFSSWVSGWVV